MAKKSLSLLGKAQFDTDILECRKSKKGNSFTQFRISVKEYDDAYDDKCHYEVFSCMAFGDVAERIGRKKIRKGSTLLVSGELSLAPRVCEPREEIRPREGEKKGHTRYVDGLEVKVLDIEIVQTSSGVVKPKAEQQKEEKKEEIPKELPTDEVDISLLLGDIL